MNLESIKGLGPKRIKLLKKLNISNLTDLVFYSPNYYEDRQTVLNLIDLRNGMDALIKVKLIRKEPIKRLKGKMTIINYIASDGESVINISFFNQSWINKNLNVGDWYYFFGRIKEFKGELSMNSPIFSKNKNSEIGSVVPVYPLTKDLSNRVLRGFILEALKKLEEFNILPATINEKYNLPQVKDILRMVHFPETVKEAEIGMRMMAYIEAFSIQIASSNGKKIFKRTVGSKFVETVEEREFLRNLPFKLTEGQKSSILEIKEDLESDLKMSRLLQGDVGSGKTVIAQYAAVKSVASGFQCAFMAPTSILAEQNFKKIKEVFNGNGFRVELLTANLGLKDREKILIGLEKGDVDIIVGTHSLLNEDVRFNNIGLVIIDEQHRFGVNQRKTLAEKTEGINLLLMSATPIPRSLALILYGEMDISEIRSLPKGRQIIETYALAYNQMNAVNEFVYKEINKGRQAYYVCPLIEESEKLKLIPASDLYEELKKRFPSFKIGLVTGKTGIEEKDKVMSDFYKGIINILVSTTVIEVGIDVPNASCIVIMNAERFGLSQLHQLRGRVGRGNHKSYCLLINSSKSQDSFVRIKIMEKTSDGFEIAKEDLRLRGPGEFLGLKQHGRQKLRFLNFEKDMDIIIRAKKDFEDYLEEKNDFEWEKIKESNKLFISEMAQEIS